MKNDLVEPPSLPPSHLARQMEAVILKLKTTKWKMTIERLIAQSVAAG